MAISKEWTIYTRKNWKKILSKLLNSKIKIIGAGRTDKGVHALGQHANFRTNKKIENKKILEFKFFFK